VRFPAIAEADETHRLETLSGPRLFTRRRGEALDPGREPIQMLDAIRRRIGEYSRTKQNKDAPLRAAAAQLSIAWLKFHFEQGFARCAAPPATQPPLQ
jgi:hypothetical protein